MPADKKTVEHIAKLARLELDETEKELFAKQLDSILRWVEQLEAVDTSAVLPTAHALGSVNVMREDAPKLSGDRSAVLANVPSREYDFVKVKKVIE